TCQHRRPASPVAAQPHRSKVRPHPHHTHTHTQNPLVKSDLMKHSLMPAGEMRVFGQDMRRCLLGAHTSLLRLAFSAARSTTVGLWAGRAGIGCMAISWIL